MAYRNNNAEGSSPGTTLAASQSGSGDAFDAVTLFGSATTIYTTDSKMHGNQCYRVNITTGTDTSIVEYQGANDLSGGIRFYFCLVGRPSGATQIAGIRSAGAGAVGINITTTSKVQIVDTTGGNIFTFTNSLNSGVWYRIEVGITVATSTTGTGAAAYYLGDATTPVEPINFFSAANLGTGNITTARFGKITATSSVCTLYFDDFAFTNGSANLIGGFSPSGATAWIKQ